MWTFWRDNFMDVPTGLHAKVADILDRLTSTEPATPLTGTFDTELAVMEEAGVDAEFFGLRTQTECHRHFVY